MDMLELPPSLASVQVLDRQRDSVGMTAKTVAQNESVCGKQENIKRTQKCPKLTY